MLDLFMGLLAFLVCVAIVPAFALATGFAAFIPLFGIGLVGQLFSKERQDGEDSRIEGNLESLDDWRKRQISSEEDVWRHAG
jgi:hypothetical protein